MKLALISMGKAAGFSLREIAGIFGRDRAWTVPRAAIAARADAVERERDRLEVLARLLRHVAACPADNHLDCPRFRKLLRVVGDQRPKTSRM
ncbi:MAG: MerR family DNA-binding protein [Pseudomonadota bacterium]